MTVDVPTLATPSTKNKAAAKARTNCSSISSPRDATECGKSFSKKGRGLTGQRRCTRGGHRHPGYHRCPWHVPHPNGLQIQDASKHFPVCNSWLPPLECLEHTHHKQQDRRGMLVACARLRIRDHEGEHWIHRLLCSKGLGFPVLRYRTEKAVREGGWDLQAAAARMSTAPAQGVGQVLRGRGFQLQQGRAASLEAGVPSTPPPAAPPATAPGSRTAHPPMAHTGQRARHKAGSHQANRCTAAGRAKSRGPRRRKRVAGHYNFSTSYLGEQTEQRQSPQARGKQKDGSYSLAGDRLYVQLRGRLWR